MDADHIERFHQRSAYERTRVAPPDGFPALPDLPLGRYTDPAFFELEREYLWRRVWLYAAHGSELPEPGSYKLVDVVGAPIVLVQGDDGVVRAFYNACRHRGAPVVRGTCGAAPMLVCQYHSWGYDLCGELVRVPEERDFVGLVKEERGLTPVRCEAWGGWYFVTLDGGVPPLLDWLDPLPGLLPELTAARFRMIDTTSVTVRCNWKVMAEGFLEVYHARTIHPQTVALALDGRGAVMSLFDHGHQSMVTPLHEHVLAAGRRDQREAVPPFPGATELFFTTNPAYGVFPNLVTPLDARGFPFLVFHPVAIDETRLDVVWFAPDWGEGPNPHQAAWDRRLAGFDLVMGEDYANLEPIQRSVESAGHGGVVLSYQERRIWHVHAWIDKVIGPERIAEELRVDDLLAGWTDRP